LAGALSLLARKEVIAFVWRTGKVALLRMRPSAFTNVPGLPCCLAGPTERRPVRRGIGWVALNSSVWRGGHEAVTARAPARPCCTD